MLGSRSEKSFFTDTWRLEIISCFYSVLGLIALIILCRQYDTKPIFQWHGMTLNTWVSTLATASKMLLLFTVSACISQWKYISFARGRRRLIEFDIYESASRGPEGSVRLLWRSKFQSLATIGALITILTAANDPFVQQIIGIKELQVLSRDGSTSVPRAVRYSKGTSIFLQAARLNIDNTFYSSLITSSDFSMQAAVLAGLSNSKETITQQLPLRCPSGKCQWEPYESLAVCSACSDVTLLLEKTTKDYTKENPYGPQAIPFWKNNPGVSATAGIITTYGFANALHLDVEGGLNAVSLGTSDRSKTVTFTKNNLLLWSTTMIKLGSSPDASGKNQSVTAAECGLYYCVRKYTSRVINGAIAESFSTVPADISKDSWQMLEASQIIPSDLQNQLDTVYGNSSGTVLRIPRTDLQLDGMYNISQVAVNGIAYQMRSIFTYPGEVKKNATGFYIAASTKSQQGIEQDQYSPDSMYPLYHSTNLTKTFEAIADSMSNNMRLNDDNHTILAGTTSVTVYRINWPWITLPCVVVLGSCVFLALTIIHTRAQKLAVWKSSSLAVLKCGSQLTTRLAEEKYVGKMEEKAKNEWTSLFDSRWEEHELERHLVTTK